LKDQSSKYRKSASFANRRRQGCVAQKASARQGDQQGHKTEHIKSRKSEGQLIIQNY
jgi:hypothetical protein